MSQLKQNNADIVLLLVISWLGQGKLNIEESESNQSEVRIKDGGRLRQKTRQPDGLAQTCANPTFRPHLCELILLGYNDVIFV